MCTSFCISIWKRASGERTARGLRELTAAEKGNQGCAQPTACSMRRALVAAVQANDVLTAPALVLALREMLPSDEAYEEITRIAQRVMGRSHPFTAAIEEDMQNARAALRALETQPRSA